MAARRSKLLVGSVAAAVGCGLVLAIVMLRPMASVNPPAGSTSLIVHPGPTQRASLRYPHEIVVHDLNAPRLPSTAVGHASFVSTRYSTYNLVMPSGDQFKFGLPDDDPWATLSPDGRFLVWGAGAGAVLRDLLGESERQLDIQAVRAWSANSGWLLAHDAIGPVTLDVRTGATPDCPPISTSCAWTTRVG